MGLFVLHYSHRTLASFDYYNNRGSLRKKFPPICPDFVIEVRSTSDALRPIQEKMEEYMENGALLGFLIDPIQQKAWIYRPDNVPELVEDFSGSLSGEKVMPGFELPLEAFKGE